MVNGIASLISLSDLSLLVYRNAVDLLIILCVCVFAISRAAPVAYGGSQARGLIRAVAAGLHLSHSNTGSEPHLQPIPQLTTTPDP